MIYLIDDKKKRQNDYGWNASLFSDYVNDLIVIYDTKKFYQLKENILSDNNILLFHESFPEVENEIAAFREYAKKNRSFKLVIFGGSKKTREINDYCCDLPVNYLYKNLKVFISKIINDKQVNFEYLFYGENIELERTLQNELERQNNDLDCRWNNTQKTLLSNSLLIRSLKYSISKSNLSTFNIGLINDKSIEDGPLSLRINSLLGENKYETLFIPISLGKTLSDFNGLRLATHIRCSKTCNQLTVMSNFEAPFLGNVKTPRLGH